ncbi:hypothetical protein MKW98_007816 [Papaver atlanticum]|uniref:alpha-1,2-Mannosidase n=1 Tax=Papaver atlanticum TaxID=357466 RepID=A0AAD4RYC8_9MAGN|nr:hypothetical protein MKW98_007816 [Papaver atlanticum]
MEERKVNHFPGQHMPEVQTTVVDAEVDENSYQNDSSSLKLHGKRDEAAYDAGEEPVVTGKRDELDAAPLSDKEWDGFASISSHRQRMVSIALVVLKLLYWILLIRYLCARWTISKGNASIVCIIRVVGGLLSSFDLSGHKVLLEKAKDVTDRLLPAWDSPSGIPYNRINLQHGDARNPGWTGDENILGDSGTKQLEFIAFSQRTGDPKYQQKVENVIAQLQKTFPADGLLAIYSTITFGAMGDRMGVLCRFQNQTEQTIINANIGGIGDGALSGLVMPFVKCAPKNLVGEANWECLNLWRQACWMSNAFGSSHYKIGSRQSQMCLHNAPYLKDRLQASGVEACLPGKYRSHCAGDAHGI